MQKRKERYSCKIQPEALEGMQHNCSKFFLTESDRDFVNSLVSFQNGFLEELQGCRYKKGHVLLNDYMARVLDKIRKHCHYRMTHDEVRYSFGHEMLSVKEISNVIPYLLSKNWKDKDAAKDNAPTHFLSDLTVEMTDNLLSAKQIYKLERLMYRASKTGVDCWMFAPNDSDAHVSARMLINHITKNRLVDEPVDNQQVMQVCMEHFGPRKDFCKSAIDTTKGLVDADTQNRLEGTINKLAAYFRWIHPESDIAAGLYCVVPIKHVIVLKY
ncbi:MAG: hypothetical protein ABIF10_01615 [Candidatus Woesearchaeota archaeon]